MKRDIEKEDLDQIEIDQEPSSDDDTPVAIKYDIASYPSDYTLSVLREMHKSGSIVIPNYQREYIWTIKQASLLIDSFLSGLPVPPVFFYIDNENKNLVIDGQQRILSVIFFFEGYFGRESTHGKRQTFRLTGLHESNPNNKKKFSDLSESDQRKLEQSVLRAINIRQLNPDDEGTSAYHIFERLNTGGTALKPQEIRNCVFRGEFSRVLKDLNKDSAWRKILGRSNVDKHQRDIELMLRIFALMNDSDAYEKPIKEFLNRAMKDHRSGNTTKVKQFCSDFPLVTRKVVDQLGSKPFHIRGPINISVLDSVLCVLMEEAHKIEFIDLHLKFNKLIQNDKFIEYTKTNPTDKKTVLSRLAKVREILLS